MKLVLCVCSLLLTSGLAQAAVTFPASSAIPGQMQDLIGKAVAKECPSLQDLRETNTNAYDAAGETYYETKLSNATSADVTVISGVGRLGGMAVIKVDCGTDQ